MDNAQLSAIATSLETKAGASIVANDGRAGYWKRVAAAAERLSGTSFAAANATVEGYMLRTAMALEVLAGTSGAEETDGYTGFLKRITDALEVKAGVVGTTDMDSRLVVAAANAIFGLNSLFASGEQGVWYDTSDLSTMYQDSAGTTPAVVGQPVGLRLDKRLGLVPGAEALTNGGFDTDTAWAKGVGWSIAGGRAVHTGGTADYLTQAGATVGATYLCVIDVAVATGSGFPQLYLGGSVVASMTAPGIYTYRATVTAGALGFALRGVGECEVNSFSAKLIPGNHATQSTAAARPVLSARVNAHSKTDALGDVSWTATNVTATGTTSNGVVCFRVSPSGAGNSYIAQGVATVPAGTTVTRQIKAKADVSSTVVVEWPTPIAESPATATFNVANGTKSGGHATLDTITPLADGWYLITSTRTSTTASTTITYYVDAYGVGGAGRSVLLREPQLEGGTVATRYQRVNTNADYDTVGFPTYLEYDGVDDFLRATFPIAPPFDRISAVQSISWTAGDYIFGGANAVAGILYQIGTTPNVAIFDGTADVANSGLPVGVNGVVTESHNGASSRLAVNNGAYTTGNPGSGAPGGITIGAASNNGGAGNFRDYGLIMRQATAANSPELVTNGTFDANTTGWSPAAGATLASVSGSLVLTNTTAGQYGQANQPFATTPGKTYQVAFQWGVPTGAGAVSVFFVGTFSGGSDLYNSGALSTSGGSKVITFTATTATSWVRVGVGSASPIAGETHTFDNISVKEMAPLTDPQIAQARTYLGSKSGVVL